MKIAIVTEYYYPTLGGIQEHVHHFAMSARRLGHDVRILTPAVGDGLASVAKHPGLTEENNLRRDEQNGVIRIGRSLPFLSGGSLARASFGRGISGRLKEILRAERFDILHLHSPLMPTLPLAALRLSDTINVGTFHSDIGRSLLLSVFAPFLQRYVDRLDVAIGVSETALCALRRYFTADWRVVPNGVDVPSGAIGMIASENASKKGMRLGHRPCLIAHAIVAITNSNVVGSIGCHPRVSRMPFQVPGSKR